jgi:hypothetical protein
MRYQVIIPKSVRKELDRLPDDVAGWIWRRLAGLETEPRPPDVKQLKGRDPNNRGASSNSPSRVSTGSAEQFVGLMSWMADAGGAATHKADRFPFEVKSVTPRDKIQ